MKIEAIICAAGMAALAPSAAGQFVGPYDHANWIFNANGGDGSAVTTPTSLLLTGNDAGGANISTDYTIAAVGSGSWSFDWKYTSTDTGDFDTGGYLLNGVYTELADTLGGSGFVSISVNAGDIIGYRAFSVDGVFGPGWLEVSNFTGPVPAPTSMALISVAAMLTCRRRRA